MRNRDAVLYMTEELMEMLTGVKIIVDPVTTILTDNGKVQMTFDCYINGQWSHEDSHCYDLGDPILDEHLPYVKEAIKTREGEEDA